MESILEMFFQADAEQFRTLGVGIAGNLGLTSNDPDAIARLIIDYILPKGLLTETDYDRAITIFREPYEDNNIYETGGWSMMLEDASTQVYLLMQYLARQPEYQLK